MNSKGHQWIIKEYVRYISRATCDCGAVRYFANDFSWGSIKLAEDYNKKEGKEGNGHMVAQREPVKLKEQGRAEKNSVPQPVPPRPEGREQLKQYFEDNKEAILQDYQDLKLREFYTKWHMTSDTWTKLKRDWKLVGKMPRKSTSRPGMPKSQSHKAPVSSVSSEEKTESFKEAGTNNLPVFPPFNEQWSDYVKTNWFETYQALKELEVEQ